jgi:transposase
MKTEEIMSINKERLRLYAKGYNDTQIATATGVTSDTITKWRVRYHLPHRNRKLEERMELYLNGFSDAEIAKREGTNIKQVSSWRFDHKLPVNKAKHKSELLSKKFAMLYKRGRTDSYIAKRWNVGIKTVEEWRENTGKQPNPKNRKR